MPCFVLMGVSGCGKSSVGAALAAACQIDYIDGDDLHPQSNIDKMASGHALNDTDRAPWLKAVGRALASHNAPVLIGCSALKKQYRDWIRAEVSNPVHFIHLHAAKAVLQQRVASRPGHFMPPSLLDSQFATLERLKDGEHGTMIDIAQSFDAVVAHSKTYVQRISP